MIPFVGWMAIILGFSSCVGFAFAFKTARKKKDFSEMGMSILGMINSTALAGLGYLVLMAPTA